MSASSPAAEYQPADQDETAQLPAPPTPGDAAAQAPHEVLVFKTSVTRRKHVRRLAPLLDLVGRWNFDLEDCDCILRVEAPAAQAAGLCRLLGAHGFACKELPD